MANYFFRKQARRLLIALPGPYWLHSVCRFVSNTLDGEGFGDMTINGEERFLRSVAPDCRVFFDVGAHHGEWSAAVLRARPDAQIHCFEPVPKSFAELSVRDFPSSVVRNRLAVSSQSGRREIYLETGSFHPKPKPGGEPVRNTIDVEVMTVDEYCVSHSIAEIDLLKLDTEGHELAALQGAAKMLTAGRIGYLQFEYGPYYIYSQTLFKDIFEWLRGFGYEIFKITPRSLVKIDRYDERLENFRYKNFVASRHLT